MLIMRWACTEIKRGMSVVFATCNTIQLAQLPQYEANNSRQHPSIPHLDGSRPMSIFRSAVF